MTSEAAWAATHRTPREGMDTWTAADAGAPPGPELEGRVEVQLVASAGDWAKVRGENGWEGWVDGRLLEQQGGDDRRALLLLAVALAVLVALAVIGLVGS